MDQFQQDQVAQYNETISLQDQNIQEEENAAVRQELARMRQAVDAETMESLTRENARYLDDLELLSKRQKDQAFVDSTGKSIPYKNQKKWKIFSRREKEADYQARVEKEIEERYSIIKSRIKIRTISWSRKKKFFTANKPINSVSLHQVRNNYSEQQRRMAKNNLLVMKEQDALKIADTHPNAAMYRQFFDAVQKYCGESGEVIQLIVKESYYFYKEKRDREIEQFQSMREKLAELKKIAEENDAQEELAMLNTYSGLFDSLCNGDLKIPEDAKVYKTSGNYVKEDGKKMDTTDAKEQPLFAHEPSVNDIIQGHIGDCYLVSSLGAVVSAEPKFIKESMKDNGDGTVTVRFYRTVLSLEENGEYKSVPIYINVPKTIPENSARNALWTQIYETAFYGYEVQKSTNSEAIDKIYQKMSASQKQEFDQEKNRIEREIDSKIAKKFPNAQPRDLEEIKDWTFIAEMERFMETKRYHNQYETIKRDLVEKEEKSKVRIDNIGGGIASQVLSAMTGKVHCSYDIARVEKSNGGAETSLDEMNRLSLVYDDMLEHYFKENGIAGMQSDTIKGDVDALKRENEALAVHLSAVRDQMDALAKDTTVSPEEKKKIRETQLPDFKSKKKLFDQNKAKIEKLNRDMLEAAEIEKVAKVVARAYLAGYDANNENYAQNLSDFKGYLNRTQMRTLTGRALTDFGQGQSVNQLLEDRYVQNKLGNVVERVKKIKNIDTRLKDTVKRILDAFAAHNEENTILGYERFSGKYSKRADEMFQIIRQAAETRKAITASSFKMSADNAVAAENGEHVFEGIASNHAYMVLGTKTVLDGEKEIRYVRLKNPWSALSLSYSKNDAGVMEPKQDMGTDTEGVVEVELNHFMERFRGISVADLGVAN